MRAGERARSLALLCNAVSLAVGARKVQRETTAATAAL